jgi:predicted RNase H-like HicB family nuclease
MAIHEEVLSAARRILKDHGERSFRAVDVVRALPHLNPSSVRTHIVSRCCVNAPRNHPHKWAYFRRRGRGEYVILAPYGGKREPAKTVTEGPSTYAPAGPAADTIHVVVRRSAGYYVAECLELALVTQGSSLDELLRNLKQAIRLHLEGEDPGLFGLSARPRIAMTYEESLAGDAEA